MRLLDSSVSSGDVFNPGIVVCYSVWVGALAPLRAWSGK